MASPLLIHIKLHRMRNWQVKLMADPSGEEKLHFCVPCDENGIELRAKRKATVLEPDGSNVSVVSIRFKATPVFRMGSKMYALLLNLSKDIFETLVAQGKALYPDKGKTLHGIMGDIEPWPYN